MEEYDQYTIEIETKKGCLDYLIIDLAKNEELTDEVVLEQFDLYKNDEAGEHLKDDELESYAIIRKD